MIPTFATASGGAASCVDASGRFRTSGDWSSGLGLGFSRVYCTSMAHMTMTVPVGGVTMTNVLDTVWTIIVGFFNESYRKKRFVSILLFNIG